MTPTIEEVNFPNDDQLTMLYNHANGIKLGERPPISTKFIFAAMRKAYEEGRKERQPEIDRLMLEYCPDEMTEQQKSEWAANQKPVSSEQDAIIRAAAIRNNTGE